MFNFSLSIIPQCAYMTFANLTRDQTFYTNSHTLDTPYFLPTQITTADMSLSRSMRTCVTATAHARLPSPPANGSKKGKFRNYYKSTKYAYYAI